MTLSAIGIVPKQKGYRDLVRRKKPLGPMDVRCIVLSTGLCPTDKAVQDGDWLCETEDGLLDIVTGHEVWLRILDLGHLVTGLTAGMDCNLVVRRPRKFPEVGFGRRVDMEPAPLVPWMERQDWVEHGIGGADGGLITEMVVDFRCVVPITHEIPAFCRSMLEPGAALHKLIQKGRNAHFAAKFLSVEEMVQRVLDGTAKAHAEESELTHNKVVITGPNGGAGMAASLLLTEMGYEVAAIGRRPKDDATVRRLERLGVRYFQNTAESDSEFDWAKHKRELVSELGLDWSNGRGGLRFVLDISGSGEWRTEYSALLGATGQLLDFAIPCGAQRDVTADHAAANRERTVNNTGAVGSVNFNPADLPAATALLSGALQKHAPVLDEAIVRIDGLNRKEIEAAVNDRSITKAVVYPNGVGVLA